MIVGWFSGGITSAVACSLVPDAKLIYIETGSHHPDSLRFKDDCERWLNRPIEVIQSSKYESHFDVIEKRRFLNGPAGALCTSELKRKVRMKWERDNPGRHTYVWGFEHNPKEQNRADRIKLTVPEHDHLFPLIDAKLTKQDCFFIVDNAGIEMPEMYKLGFNNNNCVGCVKGGMAYWNKIREHFPDVFNRMAKAEREIGRSCLKRYFLDSLPLDAGRGKAPTVLDCGSVGEGCETSLSRQYHGRE